MKNSWIFLKKVKNYFKSVWIEAGELKFCMNMLYFECFEACLSDFEVLDIFCGFLEKIANSLVCNMWKYVASDFCFWRHIRRTIYNTAGSFHANLTNWCHPGSKISKLIFFVDSASNSKKKSHKMRFNFIDKMIICGTFWKKYD
jgi:hypothetical protein